MRKSSFTFNETRILARGGFKLAVYSWKQKSVTDAPLCFIVHGMAEYGMRYERFVMDLKDTGWSFAAFDMRGHGRSEGRRMRMGSIQEPLDDLDSALSFVRGRLQRKRNVVLLGHSFGGLVAVLYAALNPQELSGIVLSSPSIGIHFLFPFMDKFIGLLHRLAPNVVIPKPVKPHRLSHDPFVKEAYVSDPQIYKFTGIDFLRNMLKGMNYAEQNIRNLSVPMLMILGGDDRIVDNRKNLSFFNRIRGPAKEIQIFDGFLHETFNELQRQESIDRVRMFLNERKQTFVPKKNETFV